MVGAGSVMMIHQTQPTSCLYRRRWKTMKPPSAVWPSSSTSCTRRRWSFSTHWCEALPASGSGPRLLGRREKMELPGHFQYILTALNKVRRKQRRSSSFCSWPGQPWFHFALWLLVPEQPWEPGWEPWWPCLLGGGGLALVRVDGPTPLKDLPLRVNPTM